MWSVLRLIPFADDIQYLIKAVWTQREAFGTKAMTEGNGNPVVRIAGFQPALSLDRASYGFGIIPRKGAESAEQVQV